MCVVVQASTCGWQRPQRSWIGFEPLSSPVPSYLTFPVLSSVIFNFSLEDIMMSYFRSVYFLNHFHFQFFWTSIAIWRKRFSSPRVNSIKTPDIFSFSLFFRVSSFTLKTLVLLISNFSKNWQASLHQFVKINLLQTWFNCLKCEKKLCLSFIDKKY